MRQRPRIGSGRRLAAVLTTVALAYGCATTAEDAAKTDAGKSEAKKTRSAGAVAAAKPIAVKAKAAKVGKKGKDAEAVRAEVLAILPKTVAPQNGYARELNDKAGEPMTLLVPAGAASLSQVIRPRAEVRVGPGPQFDLADEILEQGTQVVVFDARGVWRKAVPLTRLTTLPLRGGWVHEKALAPPFPNREALAVDRRLLPTVIAVRDVPSARTFPAKAQVATAVPRGTLFRALSFAASDVLVWVPETNSMMWISGKDVQ
jgi:hypothetical protein